MHEEGVADRIIRGKERKREKARKGVERRTSREEKWRPKMMYVCMYALTTICMH